MAKDPYPASSTDRLELLQTPFNIRLYGRPINGITIDRAHLNGRIGERSDARALKKAVRSWGSQASKGKRSQSTEVTTQSLAEAAAPFYDAEQSTFVLANIYGYMQGNGRVVLPRPVTFLVDDGGEDAWGWDELFPAEAKAFRCWEVDPREVTLRFDTRQGSFDELLLTRRAARPRGSRRDRTGRRDFDPRRRQPALHDPLGARSLRGAGREREESAADRGALGS